MSSYALSSHTHYTHTHTHTQPLVMTLLDIPPMMESLNGVVMELQDCALTLLKGQS